MRLHWEYCSAPICEDTIKKDGVNTIIWYPGELVCKRTPLSKPQRAQRKINKWMEKGKFKNPDRAFTYGMLKKLNIVRTGVMGVNPENPRMLKRFS